VTQERRIPLRKRTFIAALLALGVGVACVAGTAGARPTATVKGAGSSFVAPLVALWTTNYKASQISYNPVGRWKPHRRRASR